MIFLELWQRARRRVEIRKMYRVLFGSEIEFRPWHKLLIDLLGDDRVENFDQIVEHPRKACSWATPGDILADLQNLGRAR